jgi:phosphoesterase RecJ-like protein
MQTESNNLLIGSDSLLISEIGKEIKVSQRILVVSHIRPDGDAVGSLLGMGLALQSAGKDVQMVLPDAVPANLRHLRGSDQISLRPSGVFDLVIVLDVSDLPRIGNVLDGYGIPDINIDHHYTNERFARLNLVECQAVATSEIIAKHILALGILMTEAVADALLTGMITDTIGFRTKNVNAATMRIVADLMDAGGCLSEMYYPALVQHSYSGASYWGAGLSRLKYMNGLVWTYLSLEDRHKAGYKANDDADLINILSAIEGADVAMILVEQSTSRVKISWRLCGHSFQDIDVSQIAKMFGGGGHKAAAGAEMNSAIAEAITTAVEVTLLYLSQQLHHTS